MKYLFNLPLVLAGVAIALFVGLIAYAFLFMNDSDSVTVNLAPGAQAVAESTDKQLVRATVRGFVDPLDPSRASVTPRNGNRLVGYDIEVQNVGPGKSTAGTWVLYAVSTGKGAAATGDRLYPVDDSYPDDDLSKGETRGTTIVFELPQSWEIKELDYYIGPVKTAVVFKRS